MILGDFCAKFGEYFAVIASLFQEIFAELQPKSAKIRSVFLIVNRP
jgi:hypothetical protein